MPEIDIDYPLEHSNHGRILNAVRDRLSLLDLPALPLDRIQIREFAWDLQLRCPYVLVSRRTNISPWPDGTLKRDDVQFGTMISMVYSHKGDITSRPTGLSARWMEHIHYAMHNQSHTSWPIKLLTGYEFFHSWVEAGEPHIQEAAREGYIASYWLVRHNVRCPRATSPDDLSMPTE